MEARWRHFAFLWQKFTFTNFFHIYELYSIWGCVNKSFCEWLKVHNYVHINFCLITFCSAMNIACKSTASNYAGLFTVLITSASEHSLVVCVCVCVCTSCVTWISFIFEFSCVDVSLSRVFSSKLGSSVISPLVSMLHCGRLFLLLSLACWHRVEVKLVCLMCQVLLRYHHCHNHYHDHCLHHHVIIIFINTEEYRIDLL